MSAETGPGPEEAKSVMIAFETAWNANDTASLVALCSDDCHWRTEAGNPTGRREIRDHVIDQSTGRLGHRVAYSFRTMRGLTVSVSLVREWRDEDGDWRRIDGEEVWRLNDEGLIESRVVDVAAAHPPDAGAAT